VNGAETAAGGGRVELALRLDVAPEHERVVAVLVWPGVEQVARLDDGRAGAHEMARDVQLAHDVVRIDAGLAARHARDEWQRPEVDEDVPRAAEHDGVVATKAVRLGDGDRCGHRRHGAS